MSKHHHHHHQECCPQMMGQSMPGFGTGGYGGGFGGAGFSGGGGQGAGSGIRWIYALLILIVIVLQFGKRENRKLVSMGGSCDCELAAAKDEIAVTAVGGCSGLGGLFNGSNELIDNSVLFIIVVFLLILCTGCWTGGCGNYGDGKAGYGAGGGCGSF